jgi:hypothetical protein
MDVGRWYRDNDGQEFRFIGLSNDESVGIFSDGDKTLQKSLSEFQDMPKETKLFRFFAKGGITASDLLEARSFFGETEWNKLTKQDRIQSAKYLKRTGKIGYKKGGKLPEPLPEQEESQEYYASMQYDEGGSLPDWVLDKITHYDIIVVAKSKPSSDRNGWATSVTFNTRVEAESEKEAKQKGLEQFKKLYPYELVDFINVLADTSAILPDMPIPDMPVGIEFADGGQVDKFYEVKEEYEDGKLIYRGQYAEGGDVQDVQKIKNSIQEGELILRAGKSYGRKLSADELSSIRESVNRERKKIGLEETKYAEGGKVEMKILPKYKEQFDIFLKEKNVNPINAIYSEDDDIYYYTFENEEEREKIFIEFDSSLYDEMAKGGKLPIVRTQFEEEEFEYEDGGILADMSNREKAKVFAFLDEYTKSDEVTTWWDFFGYTKEQGDEIEKGWAKSRGYMGKGGKITKYDDGAFSGYKMNRDGKDWFIIKGKNYDNGKVQWNVYANSVDGANWIDGFGKKYSAIYYIRNIYTNPDSQ